jgi:predicted outer membrane protein
MGTRWRGSVIYKDFTNEELAVFLRGAAGYFRKRDTGGEDAAFWANEANAERCEIAAARLAAITLGE